MFLNRATQSSRLCRYFSTELAYSWRETRHVTQILNTKDLNDRLARQLKQFLSKNKSK